MRTKIRDFLKKYLGLTIIISALLGAIFSWAVTWILPSRDVTVSNIPQKELTCTLDYFYPMISRKSSDTNLQLLYDGKPVNSPYAYGITITNTGAYAVSNEDFKDAFSIDFSGSSQLVYAQVVKSSNGTIKEEVLSNTKMEGTILSITDFYLNTDESFGVYLIVDGKPDTISYHSRISGISKLTLRNTPKERQDNFRRIGIWGIYAVITFLLASTFGSIIMSRKWKKQQKEFAEKFMRNFMEGESNEKEN